MAGLLARYLAEGRRSGAGRCQGDCINVLASNATAAGTGRRYPAARYGSGAERDAGPRLDHDFFALSLGVVTYHLTTPAHSFIGRHAGGFFIYAIMVMDAYLWARYRHGRWQQA